MEHVAVIVDRDLGDETDLQPCPGDHWRQRNVTLHDDRGRIYVCCAYCGVVLHQQAAA